MRGYQKSQEEFVNEAEEKHKNYYTYERTKYVRSVDKLIVTCPDHGDFVIQANHHLRGKGCKCCAVKANAASRLLGQDVFLKRAQEAHGNRYDYSQAVVKRFKDKIEVICEKHGMFKITPHAHVLGGNCPVCSAESRASSQTKTREEFLTLCHNVHGNKYDYSLVKNYFGAKSKVKIICNEHGEFEQIAEQHYSGGDCPMCKPGGYNNKLPGSFYILQDGDTTKVGITNKSATTRAKLINSRGKMNFEVFLEIHYKNGNKPQEIEKVALLWLRSDYKSIEPKFNGSTECFNVVNIERLMEILSPLI